MQVEYPNGRVVEAPDAPPLRQAHGPAKPADSDEVAGALHTLVKAIMAETDPKRRKAIKREAAKLIHQL